MIFDLFGTVLDEQNNDWKKGMDYLFDHVFENVNREDVFKLAKNFMDEHMRNRTITFIEPKMIDQLEMFKKHFAFVKDVDIYEVEYQFLVASRKCFVKKDLINLLTYLNNYKNDLYIMSNTIFSAKSIKRLMNDFGIFEYFIDVFTSADFGYRKPSHLFFDYVINNVTKGLNHLKEDIILVGDSFEKDILGGISSGLYTIWLSKDENNNGSDIEGYVIKRSMMDIKEYLMHHFIYIGSIANDYSVTDGIGNRLVVYFQGCNLHCKGCHNEVTWDIAAGKRKHVKTVAVDILKRLNRYSKNITISGGEPLLQKEPLLNLLKILNKYDVNICLYTGNDFSEVSEDIRSQVNYVKSGSFDIDKKVTTIGFYGSYNQSLWRKGENEVWEKMKIK